MMLPIVEPFTVLPLRFVDARNVSRARRGELRVINSQEIGAVLAESGRDTGICEGSPTEMLALGCDIEKPILRFQVTRTRELLGLLTIYNIEVQELSSSELLISGVPLPGVRVYPGANGRRDAYVGVLGALLDTELDAADGFTIDFGRFVFPGEENAHNWSQRDAGDSGGAMAVEVLDILAGRGNALERNAQGLPLHITRKGRGRQPPPSFPGAAP